MSELLNKDRLAWRLGWSLPTLSDRIKRNPGFPVRRRGTKGHPWEFDLAEVQAWIAQQERGTADAEQAHRRRVAAMVAEAFGRGPVRTLTPLALPSVPDAQLHQVAVQFGKDYRLPVEAIEDLQRRLEQAERVRWESAAAQAPQ